MRLLNRFRLKSINTMNNHHDIVYVPTLETDKLANIAIILPYGKSYAIELHDVFVFTKEERENLISYLSSEKQFAEIQFKALGIGDDQTFAQKVNSCIALANESKNKISFTKEELKIK